MKKNELQNGDIVVTRHGNVAVVIRDERDFYLLYQYSGWESLDDYDEDMVYQLTESEQGGQNDAIMQVYRAMSGISFSDFQDDMPVYERDESWVVPTEGERFAAAQRTLENKKQRRAASL